ncbi:MAG: thioredoxin domain-containing protein, partial [Proteobacteria bacterium]|nr:thioredoxin domain-containing protein [Pseudomonadota bacterium]
MHRFTISLAIGLALLSGCHDSYPVEQCNPGQGLAIENKEVPYHGEASASVHATVFADLKCPYSMRLILALNEFTDRLESDGRSGEFKWHYRHYLRPGYVRSEDIAHALSAAYRQGNDAFWQMLWLLFVDDDLTSDKILRHAETADLDLEQFQADLISEEVEEEVLRDNSLAKEIGFPGTPGVVLCGVRVESD